MLFLVGNSQEGSYSHNRLFLGNISDIPFDHDFIYLCIVSHD